VQRTFTPVDVKVEKRVGEGNAKVWQNTHKPSTVGDLNNPSFSIVR